MFGKGYWVQGHGAPTGSIRNSLVEILILIIE